MRCGWQAAGGRQGRQESRNAAKQPGSRQGRGDGGCPSSRSCRCCCHFCCCCWRRWGCGTPRRTYQDGEALARLHAGDGHGAELECDGERHTQQPECAAGGLQAAGTGACVCRAATGCGQKQRERGGRRGGRGRGGGVGAAQAVRTADRSSVEGNCKRHPPRHGASGHGMHASEVGAGASPLPLPPPPQTHTYTDSHSPHASQPCATPAPPSQQPRCHFPRAPRPATSHPHPHPRCRTLSRRGSSTTWISPFALTNSIAATRSESVGCASPAPWQMGALEPPNEISAMITLAGSVLQASTHAHTHAIGLQYKQGKEEVACGC